MDKFTKEDLEKALPVIASMISRSEKVHNKFKEGTPQFSLIKNRLKALYLSSSLILKELKVEVVMDDITYEDLKESLPPITSTIGKCEKIMEKTKESAPHLTLTRKMLNALYISTTLIKKELEKYEI
jgi:hypothetical protein